jgi:hypothetical protein
VLVDLSWRLLFLLWLAQRQSEQAQCEAAALEKWLLQWRDMVRAAKGIDDESEKAIRELFADPQ